MDDPHTAEDWLRSVYRRLADHFGPQHWWPGDTRTEIIVGAILTQNTAWTNVERAIHRLRQENLLTLARLEETDEDRLSEVIRPAGTFRVKARRIKAFVRWSSQHYGHDLDALFATPTKHLRPALLGVLGIGPETADAILLYAGGQPVFVIDAYTRRVLRRHFHFHFQAETSYERLREWFESNLAADADLYGEFHALFVALAKQYCRVRARCDGCPLMCLPHDADR